MLRELSLSELGIWTALWNVNPWGELRADQRSAIGTALLANVNRDSAKQPEPFTARDFMPYLAPDPKAEAAKLELRLVSILPVRQVRRPEDKAERKRRRQEVKKGRK